MRRLVCVLVLAVAVGGCGGDAKPRTEVDGLADAVAENISISRDDAEAFIEAADTKVRPKDLPRGWVPGVDGYWTGLPENGFAPNVNVYSFKNDPRDEVTTEDTMLQSKASIDSMLKQADVVDEGADSFGPYRGHFFEYEASAGEFRIHGRQHMISAGGRIYAITGTGLAEDWSEQKAEILGVMNSFDLEKRES